MRDGNEFEEGVQDVEAPGKKCLVESITKVQLGRKKIRVGHDDHCPIFERVF